MSARSEQATGDDRLRQRVLRGLPLADRRYELAGVPTAVLEGGQGDPMVLLHGQGELAATWAAVLPRLAERHRVVVPDLPGHGGSGIGEDPLDTERTLAWLDELIRATCAAPPVLVGHLLGGAIALRYAARHAGSLSGLVLVDTLGLAPYRPSPTFAVALAGFMARPTEGSRDRLFRRCFTDLGAVGDNFDGRWDALAAYALECAKAPEQKAALRSLMPKLALPAVPAEVLSGITVPVTLIHGRDDLQVRLRVAEAAGARHGWPLHVVDGAGDDPPAEQPAAFLDALDSAVAQR